MRRTRRPVLDRSKDWVDREVGEPVHIWRTRNRTPHFLSRVPEGKNMRRPVKGMLEIGGALM
jgi:hypothetical protein